MITSRTEHHSISDSDKNFYRTIGKLTDPTLGSDDVVLATTQLQKNSQAKHYLHAYSLASNMVTGRISVENPEHVRYLSIAQANPEEQYKFDFSEITDRLVMESRTHAGSKNIQKELELFYKGFGKIAKAGELVTHAGGKIGFIRKPVAYTTKTALKGAKWYFDHKAKSIHDMPKFEGFCYEELEARFKNLKNNSKEFEKLTNNTDILFSPSALHKGFVRHLEKIGFSKESHEKISNQEFFTIISENPLKKGSMGKESRIQKEAREYIKHNRILNQYHESLKILEEKKLDESKIANAKLAFQFVGFLGDQIKNKDVKNIAVIGSAAMDIYAGYSTLSGVTSSLGMLSAMSSAVPVVGAFLQIGMSLFQIANVFKKQRSTNTESPSIKRLDMIISQIYNMHMEMRQSFQHVFENQQRIHQSITDGFHYLDTMIHTEIHHLKDFIQDKFIKIDQNIHHLSEQLKIGISEIHLMEFKRVLGKTTALLEGRRKHNLESLVEEIDDELLSWISSTDDIPLSSSNKFHTGSVWIESENKMARDEAVIKILEGFDESKLNQLLGYLASYAEKHLNLKWHDSESVDIDVSEIFNPLIWCEGVEKYIEFRNKFQHLINCPELSFNRIMRAGINTVNFIERIHYSPDLFQQLFERYQNALENIVSLLKKSIEEKNQEINKKIVEKFYKEEKNASEIKLDLSQNLDGILQAFKGKLPPKTTISGEKIELTPKGYTDLFARTGKHLFIFKWTPTNVQYSEFPALIDVGKVAPEYLLLNHLEFGEFEIKYKIHITAVEKGLPSIGELAINTSFKLNEKSPTLLFNNKYNIPAQATACAFKHYTNGPHWIHAFYYQIESRTSKFYQSVHDYRVNHYGWGGPPDYGSELDHNAIAREYLAGADAKPIETLSLESKESPLADIRKMLSTQLFQYRKMAVKQVFDNASSSKIIEDSLNTLEANRLLLLAYAHVSGMSQLMMSELIKLPSAFQIKENLKRYQTEAESTTLEAISLLQFPMLVETAKQNFLNKMKPAEEKGLGLESKSEFHSPASLAGFHSQIALKIKSYLTKLACCFPESKEFKAEHHYDSSRFFKHENLKQETSGQSPLYEKKR